MIGLSSNSSIHSDTQRKNHRFGTYSVDLAIKAGLDLEMPGPTKWRSPTLVIHMLSSQKLLIKDLNQRAETILTFIQKLARRNPDVVYGDGREGTRDSPEARKFCRKLTAQSLVLLKNTNNVLPLTPKKVKSIAIIGPHAKDTIISGGGSAALKPSYVITPFEGISANCPSGIDVRYTVGCYGKRISPTDPY